MFLNPWFGEPVVLVAPYRAILRYYRCHTPYRAILSQPSQQSPNRVRYPPLVPFFYTDISVRYPIVQHIARYLCDTPGKQARKRFAILSLKVSRDMKSIAAGPLSPWFAPWISVGFRHFCGLRDFRQSSTQLLVCSCLSCFLRFCRFRDFRRFRETPDPHANHRFRNTRLYSFFRDVRDSSGIFQIRASLLVAPSTG